MPVKTPNIKTNGTKVVNGTKPQVNLPTKIKKSNFLSLNIRISKSKKLNNDYDNDEDNKNENNN